MAIYYFTPYALDKNLGAAYNHYMTLLPNDDDWACFIDGDAMFLSPDWGHLIQKAIDMFPETGMFTCYTNRVGNNQQLYRGIFSNNRDIVAHRNIARVCHEIGKNRAKKLSRMISGVMMIIQKKTWKYFPFKDGLLSVDNDISKRLMDAGKEIRLIESIYLLHYYRIAEGKKYIDHLKLPKQSQPANQPLLNILIRTSNRPNYFKRLMENIKSQNYENYRLLISSDSVKTTQYVARFTNGKAKITEVPKLLKTPEQTFPWNLYLNTLMDEVKEGWILFMDDDDRYTDSTTFKQIAANLPAEDSMLVWRLRFPDGRYVPETEYLGRTPFVRKQIAMPCFAFHSKWKNMVRFDGQRAGDFRVANRLQEFLKVKWLKLDLVQLDNFGNVGKEVDLEAPSGSPKEGEIRHPKPLKGLK